MVAFDKSMKKEDEYYTPKYAVLPIVKYLKSGSSVWCPFDTQESNFVKVLRSRGHRVVHSHISEGCDFFNCSVPECDYIVSNPPYSIKNEVLSKLYEIGKPFAMLIGCLGMFEGKRFGLFKNFGVEILVLNRRISYFKSFEIQDKSTLTQPPFQSWYICHGILPSQIVFHEIARVKVDNSAEQLELF